MERNQRVNEQIRVPQVRVVSEEGEQLGIMATEDAFERARNAQLDLVEVAPTEKPPVCRIMDYGKYKYQLGKRAHKSHAHRSKNKEIRLRPKIGEHDLNFKINKARQFLKSKDKVIVSVVFRGRENAHTEEGFKVVKTFISSLEEVGKVEQAASMQGRRIVAIIVPK